MKLFIELTDREVIERQRLANTGKRRDSDIMNCEVFVYFVGSEKRK